MLTRRQFIKTGIAGAATLAVARVLYGPFEREPQWQSAGAHQYQVLSAGSRNMLAALAAVMLKGALPQDEPARVSAIQLVVEGIDKAVAALQPAVQEELQQLFSLLNFPVTRRLLAGVSQPWLKADAHEIEQFIANWRESRFQLLRSGFHGLHMLVMAAWYGSPQSWDKLGYSGPPAHVLAAQAAN